MAHQWRIEFAAEAIRELDSMDQKMARRLVAYMVERVQPLDDPRLLGKALRGSKWGGYWRYRCGNYRIVVDILDREVVVMVMRVGDRKDVY